MLKGNKGEWSEPYALLKLLADGKLFLGDENFDKLESVFYPILQVIKHEKSRSIDFSIHDNIVLVSNGVVQFQIPVAEFVHQAKQCFEKIRSSKSKTGSFGIPEIEAFLNTLTIGVLKTKATLKNDITIQIKDLNTYTAPSLGFSIKSQLGRPSTLLNASAVTNFTYMLKGHRLSPNEIKMVNETVKFSDKLRILDGLGIKLEFKEIEDRVFRSNLKTIDFFFERVLAKVLILYYSGVCAPDNSIKKLVELIAEDNFMEYDLETNPSMYEMTMKRFLTDYALGMRAGEVWRREYEATGGYLVVKEDGELICYNFYFTRNFENYLYNNTKLDTASSSRHQFGEIYNQGEMQLLKLNLQIRFIR
jgi:hypothetical protein